MWTKDGALRIAALPVKELMIPMSQYPVVSTRHTIRKAVAVMERAQLDVAGKKSLPRVLLVLDEDEKLVGIVRRRDILGALLPKFLQDLPRDYPKKLFDVEVDPNLAELSSNSIVMGIRQGAERPVTDVMRPVKATISEDDHVLKAIYEMLHNNRALLPVLRGEKVTGIIRSVDVFREMVDIIK